MVKSIKLLLALFICYALFLFCHHQTEGFQITKVLSPLPTREEWVLPTHLSELETHLSQPFYYLGKGGQCFAFLSQDKKTVLKLFKMHNLCQYAWGYRLSLPGVLDQARLRFLLSQKAKLQRTFGSSHLAYTQLREETGLLYLKLNPDPTLHSLHVTVIDKLGISHKIPLDSLAFALQKHADRALLSLKDHLKQGQFSEAHETLQKILSCLQKRFSKNILDLDPALNRNIGLSDQDAIFIDIGGFFLPHRPLTQKDIFQETKALRRLLVRRAPQMLPDLDALLANENHPSPHFSME